MKIVFEKINTLNSETYSSGPYTITPFTRKKDGKRFFNLSVELVDGDRYPGRTHYEYYLGSSTTVEGAQNLARAHYSMGYRDLSQEPEFAS